MDKMEGVCWGFTHVQKILPICCNR